MMSPHTARQILSDLGGKVTQSVAAARKHGSLEQVQNEARKVITRLKKRERRRKKER